MLYPPNHAWYSHTYNWQSFLYAQSTKKGKYQESIQPSATPDPGYQWESENLTIRHDNGQPFPNDRKASINRSAQKHKKNKTEIT